MENNKYKRQNRLKDALAIRNMRQVELCELTGIKKASINGWVSQRWQPKQEALYKMAKVLDVSEMWLAGYDVPMEKPTTTNTSKVISSDKYNDFMDMVVALDDDQFLLIENMVKQLKRD